MLEKKLILRTYLLIALGFGLLGVIDSVLNLIAGCLCVYYTQIGYISGLFFFVNIIFIFILNHRKVERINYVLPVYHILTFLLITGISLSLAIKDLFSGGILIFYLIFGLLTSILEIGFCGYLLRRFGFI